VDTLQPRLSASAGTPLSTNEDNASPTTLDLTDPAQRSQFLEHLFSQGTSGSYATSNSYQQNGKAINYAISMSYSPLQSTASNKKEDSPLEEKPEKQTGKPFRPSTIVPEQRASPVLFHGQTYLYPYIYFYR
jgi:hypothetical protein